MNSTPRILVMVLLAAWVLPAAAEEAEMADGSYLTQVGIPEWDVPGHQPRLILPTPPGAQQPPAPLMLFDATNHCRWFGAAGRPFPPTPEAYVEMVGGDFLPGKVVGFRYGDESLLNQQPPCLLIKVDFPGGAPGVVDSRIIRVTVADIRRLVCKQVSRGGYTPATLYYTDGRQLVFRQLRWNSTGVTLLLDEGRTETIPFNDIGELHLPPRDSWQSYYLTLARLTTNGSNRLIRVETDMGLVITTSMDLLRVVEASHHVIQPAWSQDPIWINRYQVRMRRFFAPHEVPLSRIAPSSVIQESPLGGVRQWQADRSTRFTPLSSGRRFWAWGLAVQAQNQLVFDLPPSVLNFRTGAGLDQEALGGGCARALVYANAAEGSPLWQSPQLVGSAATADSGVIPLGGPAAGQKSLVLVADMSHQDRPAGADPLNIRDFVDWLEPTLELDPQKLAAEVAKQLPRTIPAWQDWTVSAGTNGRLVMVQRWEDQSRYRTDARAANGRIILSRSVDIPAQPSHLAMGLVANGSPSTIDVRVNGLPIAAFPAPGRVERTDPEPRFIPLQKWAGQNVTMEIEQFPTDDNSWVSWRGLAIAATTDFGTPLTIVSAAAASADTAIAVETGNVVFATQAVQAGNKERAPVPEFDTYTIIAETELTDITGLRLELLTDPRLPNYGPGRFDGTALLSEFKAAIAARGAGQAEPIAFVGAASDGIWENYVARFAIDEAKDNCWWPHPRSATHAAVFMTDHPIGFPGGSTLTFTLGNKPFGKNLVGKFRILAVTGPAPDPVPRPGVMVPLTDRGAEIFDENPEFAGILNAQGGGPAAAIDTTNRFTGKVGIRIGPGHRFNDAFLGQVRICENPAPGEARYLRFAWKKDGGQTIAVQLAHDGRQFGPVAGKTASFRYQAGPAPELSGAAVIVSKDLPVEWTVVTRDLFADFGEFVLNGLRLDVPDGAFGYFDDVRLGRTPRQVETGR